MRVAKNITRVVTSGGTGLFRHTQLHACMHAYAVLSHTYAIVSQAWLGRRQISCAAGGLATSIVTQQTRISQLDALDVTPIEHVGLSLLKC